MTPTREDPRSMVSDQGPEQNPPGSALKDTAPLPKTLASALTYVDRGWAVLPLHGVVDGRCTCGKADCSSPGKHPATRNGVKDATTDRMMIVQWFAPSTDANVGIATGAKSGIVVLDVDPRNGGDDSLATLVAAHGPLPDTVEVVTGGGGRHLYFIAPMPAIPNSSGRLGPGLDFKSDSGFVVAPPSRHVSGRRYEWEASSHPDDVAVAPMPVWIGELLSQKGGPADSEDRGRLDPTAVLAGVPEGQRDDTLFRYACRLRGIDLSREEAEILVLAAAGNCQPPFPEAEARRKVESAWSYPPGRGEPGVDHGEAPGPRDSDVPPALPRVVSNSEEWAEYPRTRQEENCRRFPVRLGSKQDGALSTVRPPCDSWTHAACAARKAEATVKQAGRVFPAEGELFHATFEADKETWARLRDRRRGRDAEWVAVQRSDGSCAMISTFAHPGQLPPQFVAVERQRALELLADALKLPGVEKVRWSDGWRPPSWMPATRVSFGAVPDHIFDPAVKAVVEQFARIHSVTIDPTLPLPDAVSVPEWLGAVRDAAIAERERQRLRLDSDDLTPGP